MALLSKLFHRHTTPTDRTEALEAITAAQADVKSAVDNQREVQKVVAELRYHRRVNHFAERIEASLRRG